MTTIAAPAPAAVDLTGHPAVEEMARDLLVATPNTLVALEREDGGPTALFMAAARDRFAERTGEHGQRMGDVAHAVLARLRELRPTS
ncbi:hypothetical protein ABTY59_32025 [Streptomyces sp. NPDC096079]|uniref:hypothetical protein n=1 Tax=Streptomyces sp. NPDC096079 TaxID=3155820 RepID=UPI003322F11B